MQDINDWQSKFAPCQYSDKLLNKLSLLNKQAKSPIDISEVTKSIYYARKYHGSQMRKSGEPYYSHPIEVASYVADFELKTEMIIAAVLHDTLEDTVLTRDEISKEFGIRICQLVERLTRVNEKTAGDTMHEAYLLKDHQTLIIKLCDRWHNLENVSSLTVTKQVKIATQTVMNFIPYAIRIGTYKIEYELRTLCHQIFNKEREVNTQFFPNYGFHLLPLDNNNQTLSLVLRNGL